MFNGGEECLPEAEADLNAYADEGGTACACGAEVITGAANGAAGSIRGESVKACQAGAITPFANIVDDKR